MLTAVKQNLALLGYSIKFNLSAAMEYRVSFIMQTLGMAINNSAFIFFWWILFENVPTIGGYGFQDVMLLWSFASTTYGLVFVIFGKVGEITQLIIGGELDTFLLQPKDPLLSILCSKSRVSAWGDLVYGVVLYFLVMGFNPLNLLMYVFFSVTASLIFSSVLVIIHSVSFHLGDFQSVADLATEFMITFSIYPEGIFGNWMKYVFYTLLPVGFMVYIPARTLVQPNLFMVLLVGCAALFWVLVAYKVFYKGLKNYESGNMIVTRL